MCTSCYLFCFTNVEVSIVSYCCSHHLAPQSFRHPLPPRRLLCVLWYKSRVSRTLPHSFTLSICLSSVHADTCSDGFVTIVTGTVAPSHGPPKPRGVRRPFIRVHMETVHWGQGRHSSSFTWG